ncbi:AbrB/MazE/SpoVT family DNA-binding domain-containing protein [Microlunatus parietis]|uniref:AbrB family looped-hinge helix DNA binding protein n=1 Tax=Microlunatus parietis TaxID=682979 RepID=A0A7Y9I9A0_9ACTN|nr:AbrB/MazE/SpoVT family DNA-binding domain-containing protein [Microlunatus parietis]NYE72547.1 AbrB family looped-hinge helix DNA binding protein [Microlunatus parietis]
MADRMDFDTKVSNEGRVVIPAAVRSVLGVGPGDRVRFVVQDGEVRLVTARSLLFAIWANNNNGGDAGDSTSAVRQARRVDIERAAGKWARVEITAREEARTEDEIEDGLLAQLGLRR